MEENKIEGKSFDVNYDISDWEDALVETLAQKHGLEEDVVLDIALTFILNEASAIVMKRPNVLSTINALDFLRLGPTTRTSMKTLKPSEYFVVGGQLCRANGFPIIVTSGEHNGEFSIEDTNGKVWYESEFENNIKVITPEDVEKLESETDSPESEEDSNE